MAIVALKWVLEEETTEDAIACCTGDVSWRSCYSRLLSSDLR